MLIKRSRCKTANVFRSWLLSEDTELYEVYGRYSEAKVQAFKRCLKLFREHDGKDIRICSHNTFGFTVGYIALIDGIESFVYYTPGGDYYTPLVDLYS